MDDDIHAFVIRVWNEGAGKNKIWRGYIEHVNHDCRYYFSDLNGVVRFIQRQVNIQSPKSGRGWWAKINQVFHAIAGRSRERYN